MTDNLMGGKAPVPAYMAGVGTDTDFGGGMDGNMYPRLAFKGGRFRIRNGEDEIVIKEVELDVVILKDYPHISRIFFDSSYDPDEGGGRPACASADGVNPLSTIPAPQNGLCATCPQNEKGSNITDDGKKSRACGFFKRLVVMVIGYEDIGPVIADMKSMTLFGESDTSANWWSLKAYFARLKQNGVLPFQIVTKLGFDTNESVPKVMFQPSEYVAEAVFTQHIAPMVATPDGEALMLEMTDTATMKTVGEEDGGDAKMALPAGAKPAYLDGPKQPEADKKTPAPTNVTPIKTAVTLEDQLATALAASDYALAAEIQTEIAKAIVQNPEPEEVPEPAGPTAQEIADGLKIDIKLAVDSGDYAKAADLQAQLAKHNGVDTDDTSADKAPTEKLSPQQKAAITRAKNKKVKEDALAALAAAGEEPAATDATPTTGKADDDLDAALTEFGFN